LFDVLYHNLFMFVVTIDSYGRIGYNESLYNVGRFLHFGSDGLSEGIVSAYGT
jgi:hypothetical protein